MNFSFLVNEFASIVYILSVLDKRVICFDAGCGGLGGRAVGWGGLGGRAVGRGGLGGRAVGRGVI